MVDISASVDEAAVRDLDDAIAEYARILGGDADTAPRRAAIQICKSLRAGTRTAPKYARSSEYTVAKSMTDPKHQYVTARDGRQLRRFRIDRPPRGKSYDVFEERKQDVRKHRLVLARRGLAKQSWGWVMHNIYSGSAPDTPWRRRRNDRRNPKDAVSESCSRRGFALISNRLDWIEDALKRGFTVGAAVTKTVNWIVHQIVSREIRRLRRG